jgi:Fur family ferric uptake transcriptional regulator
MTRKTEQRSALQTVLRNAGRPLSAQEIFNDARQVAALGIATVYRNLKTLVEQRWLVEVTLPGEPTRYEIAGQAHHHHFHCRECNRVFDVPECPPDLRRMTPAGFVLHAHDVVLYGACEQCASARGAKRGPAAPR